MKKIEFSQNPEVVEIKSEKVDQPRIICHCCGEELNKASQVFCKRPGCGLCYCRS